MVSRVVKIPHVHGSMKESPGHWQTETTVGVDQNVSGLTGL